jgi:hypothetical protein
MRRNFQYREKNRSNQNKIGETMEQKKDNNLEPIIKSPHESTEMAEEIVLSQMAEDQIIEEGENDSEETDTISHEWHTSRSRRG